MPVAPSANKGGTALAEEHTLINEVIHNANMALKGNIEIVKTAVDTLDNLEVEQNLNQKLSFNNHMVYNRIIQCINIKLGVMNDWQEKIYP